MEEAGAVAAAAGATVADGLARASAAAAGPVATMAGAAAAGSKERWQLWDRSFSFSI